METLTRPKMNSKIHAIPQVSLALLFFFTHFVKWLDNPLFTGDDRPEEPNWTELELKLKEARKPFGHFGSGKISESILKFVSRLFLVIAANLADSQASGLVTEWVLHYLTNEATEVGN